MAPFARAELEQIGRKMACNEYFGVSLVNVLRPIDWIAASRYALLAMTGWA